VCIATSTDAGAPDASEAIDAPEIDAPQPNDTGRADAGTGAS
jgi:hypothetical protein